MRKYYPPDACPFPFFKAMYLAQVLENKGVDIYFWSLNGHNATGSELSSWVYFMVYEG